MNSSDHHRPRRGHRRQNTEENKANEPRENPLGTRIQSLYAEDENSPSRQVATQVCVVKSFPNDAGDVGLDDYGGFGMINVVVTADGGDDD